MGDALHQGAARHQVLLRLSGQAGGRHEDHRARRASHLEDQQARLGPRRMWIEPIIWSLKSLFSASVQFAPALLGQHHQEPPVHVRYGEDPKSGRLLVGHRSGFHGFFLSQRDSTGEGNVAPDTHPKPQERRWECHSSLNVTFFQHAPTNKLLYARDIPIFKQEVKAYYKQVREQPPVTASEFKDFLQQESKVAPVSGQHLRGSGAAGIGRCWFLFVISETWKRVWRFGRAQRALQVHPSVLHRGQPRALRPLWSPAF